MNTWTQKSDGVSTPVCPAPSFCPCLPRLWPCASPARARPWLVRVPGSCASPARARLSASLVYPSDRAQARMSPARPPPRQPYGRVRCFARGPGTSAQPANAACVSTTVPEEASLLLPSSAHELSRVVHQTYNMVICILIKMWSLFFEVGNIIALIDIQNLQKNMQ